MNRKFQLNHINLDKVKILVVEDKIIVAEDIASTLEDLGYDILPVVNNGRDAIRIASLTAPDLLLLDINIKGDLDGIEVASKINDIRPVPIIYLSAYSDKVTLGRAKDTYPFAYIVKPFDEKDLEIAIDLAIHNFSQRHSNGLNPATSNQSENYVLKDSLFIKKESRYCRIDINLIQFVEANGSYIDIYTDGDKYTLAVNLLHFENQIKNENFMRIHRSFIINLSKVDSFDSGRAFIGTTPIPISKTYKEAFNKKLQQL